MGSAGGEHPRVVGRALGGIVIAAAAALPGLPLLPGHAAPAGLLTRPGETHRVSISSLGAETNDYSGEAAISGDGRRVAFLSDATNLVPGDTNGAYDVFVHDRATATTARVSVSSEGAQAAGASYAPAISRDGRVVAFVSDAANLVPGDTNEAADVFVHELDTGTTTRVSVGAGGEQANDTSNDPSLDAEGTTVAFGSDATNLVPGDTNGWGDTFVKRLDTGAIVRASVNQDGSQALLGGGGPSLSAGGRHVAFASISPDLDGGRGSVAGDVFLRDLVAGTTTLVSASHDGTPADDQSGVPTVSADGRFVAFRSDASNLVPGERNTLPDFFVRDVLEGRTERVSVSSSGAVGTDLWYGAPEPAISDDGRFVAFSTVASMLVEGDANRDLDVFVHDRLTRETQLVSITADGEPGAGTGVSISGDGRHVAFASSHTGMVEADGNAQTDIFVRDRGAALGAGTVRATRAGGGVDVEGWATFAGTQLASASDPVGESLAAPPGSDLSGAALAYRPHRNDLFVGWRLPAIPAAPAVQVPITKTDATGSIPLTPTVYVLALEAGGVRWELRGSTAALADADPLRAGFELFRCAPTCEATATLPGGVGDAGLVGTAAIPLELLGAQPGAVLRSVAVSTAAGAPAAVAHTLDEVALGDVTVPVASLSVAPGAADGPPPAHVFEPVPAPVSASGFRTRLVGPAPGAERLWVRACLGETCRESAAAIS